MKEEGAGIGIGFVVAVVGGRGEGRRNTMGFTMGDPIVGDDETYVATVNRTNAVVQRYFGDSDEAVHNRYPLHVTILYHNREPTNPTFSMAAKMMGLKKQVFHGKVVDVTTGGPQKDLVIVKFEIDELAIFASRMRSILEQMEGKKSEIHLYRGIGGITPHMTIAYYLGRPEAAAAAVRRFLHSDTWDLEWSEASVKVQNCRIATAK